MPRKSKSDALIPASVVFQRLDEAWESHSIFIEQGSSRSTKTFSILQKFIQEARTNKCRVLILRAKRTWMRDSLIPDFEAIMKEHFQCWDEGDMNMHDYIYKFPNGSTFTFIGLDQKDGFERAHGMTTDHVYFNECTEIDYPIVEQVLLRHRGKAVFDFNPNCPPDFYVYNIYVDAETGRPKSPDVFYHKTTYKDNPFISDEERKQVERYDPDNPENVRNKTASRAKWRIYGLGERAQIEGLVFESFDKTQDVVPEFPEGCARVCIGIDWGFSNFRTAAVLHGVCNGMRYAKELVYERGLGVLHNPDHPERKSLEKRLRDLGVGSDVPLYPDTSEPRSCDELKSGGFMVRKVEKGAGSINSGIEELKKMPLKVVAGSDNLISELEKYCWLKSRHGELLNEPEDNNNDLIDPLRYCAAMTSSGSAMVKKMPYLLPRQNFRRHPASAKYSIDNYHSTDRDARGGMRRTKSSRVSGRGHLYCRERWER